MAYNTLKELIDWKKVDWEKSEERANDLYEFTQDGLELSQWEVNMPYYGRMSFNEFLDKAKKEVRIGRYIEVTEAMFHIFADMQNHFNIVKIRFNDVFRGLLTTLEEKKMGIDAVEEKLDENEVIVEEYKLENEKLKEENKKLRLLLEHSNSGYCEMWKIIEVKMENLMSIYKDIDKVETKEEVLSYIQAMKTELNVGLKPIKAKKQFIIKQQIENLGYSVDDFLAKDKEEEPKPEIVEENIKPKKENPIKPNVDMFKNELEKMKPKPKDYEITDDELSSSKFKIYTEFEIHNDEDLYDEEQWQENSDDGVISEEEKKIRNNLIKDKLDGDELYILESEVDYSDTSDENIARAFTLIQLEQEMAHIHFGINSVRWANRFKEVYPSNLNKFKEKKFGMLNPSYLKMFSNFNYKYKS
jgi:hypothetical protein